MTKAHGQQKGNNQLQDCVTIFPIITDLLPEVPGAIVYERLPLLQGAISTSSNHPFKMFCLSTLSGKPTSTINLATSPTSCALMSFNNDFTIAAGAYTYTAMRSLPLHTPTQRYDRCHCMHLHTDTIAANAHARTAIRSLFLNTPAQRCNRFSHEHTDLHCDTIAATIKSLLKHDCKCMQASVVRKFFNYPTFINSVASYSRQHSPLAFANRGLPSGGLLGRGLHKRQWLFLHSTPFSLNLSGPSCLNSTQFIQKPFLVERMPFCIQVPLQIPR